MRCLAGVAVSLLLGHAAYSQPADRGVLLRTDPLLLRVGTSVTTLMNTLSSVISDETSDQRTGLRRSVQRRHLQSELLLWWLPDEHAWLSVRNVLSVDGRPVPDSEQRLRRAFDDPPARSASDETTNQSRAIDLTRSARVRALQEESARFDLGLIHRTTSSPTVVIEFLAPENQAHFSFVRAGTERVGGESAARLVFTEIARPTIVKVNGRDARSWGIVWVRERDGTILRTNLRVGLDALAEASITVDFQRDEKLAAWVPRKMVERYGDILCTSTYSHVRRFETSGRLILPKDR